MELVHAAGDGFERHDPARRARKGDLGPAASHSKAATVANGNSPSARRAQSATHEPPTFPRDVHLESAARPQPANRPTRPVCGKRGEETDRPVVRLQQHLRDRGRRAEVPIHLERAPA